MLGSLVGGPAQGPVWRLYPTSAHARCGCPHLARNFLGHVVHEMWSDYTPKNHHGRKWLGLSRNIRIDQHCYPAEFDVRYTACELSDVE